MAYLLKAMLNVIFSGWLNTILKALTAHTSVISDICDKTKGVMIPIASVFVCIYFMIEVIDKLTSERFNAEVFIKMLMKLVFSVIIISNASAWAIKIMNFGTDFALAVVGEFKAETVVKLKDTFYDSLNIFNILNQLGMIITLLLPFIAAFIIKIAVYFICYGRTIEMGVRSAFAPIGCADLMTGGANSNGVRYLKSLFAVALQGAVMIGVVFISSNVIASELSSINFITGIVFLPFLMKYFGIVSAMVGLLGASKSIAKEIIG